MSKPPPPPLSASMMTSAQIRAQQKDDEGTGHPAESLGRVVQNVHDPKHVPVLMTKDNPNGWKLEDLGQQLIVEIAAKSDKIKSDPRDQAINVFNNNSRIMESLRDIVNWQNNSLRAMATIAPDQGPTGKPRIGVGSEE